MLVIHTKPGTIYVTSPIPAETRDPRAYLWTVEGEIFDPNCLPNPIKHPQTRFDCGMLMMSEISSFQSPLLVHKVHDPQGKTNRSLFYTSTRSNRNLLATAVMMGSTNYDCYCETSNPKKILKSLVSSPAHIHMRITHTSTVGCKLWELGSLLHGLESARSESISDFTYVTKLLRTNVSA
jgi:hypothetical protein